MTGLADRRASLVADPVDRLPQAYREFLRLAAKIIAAGPELPREPRHIVAGRALARMLALTGSPMHRRRIYQRELAFAVEITKAARTCPPDAGSKAA